MNTFAVINKNIKGQMVVKLIDAPNRESAVLMRAGQLGGNYVGNIMFVSNQLPSIHGTGGAMLYAVDVRPAPPMPQPPYEISVATLPAHAPFLDDEPF